MREIIDVPVVETVVRLDDAADAAKRDCVVSDFVLTRQVERNLSAISQSIKESYGRGHFLIGAYGSGKSHFLSYVSLVLSGEARPRGAACPLAAAISGRRLLPVRVSLVKVRSDTRLEDAVLSSAERQLKVLGSSACISRRSRFLRHLEEAIRPVDVARMDAYLAKNSLPPWDVLRKNPDRAVVAAWGYAKTLENCSVMPEMPPDELLRDIVREAKDLSFDGAVIVIDELSEFLRSKQTRAALSDDARYLQLMGEMAGAEPVWIIASLQEAIERTGDISRDVYVKIKDRYPVTLSLDENHIRDLIDGRLVKKRDGARSLIRDVWRRFTECLPGFDIDFENFFRIYPVHPATIRYLDGLGALFSSHRGVVDFIVSQVRGDAKRENPGLLSARADCLVTADMIYGHFRDRISADSRYADFDSVARKDIHRAIDKVHRDEKDKILARRAVDVLILNEISGVEKSKTISELTRILLAAVTDVSAGANEQYLAEVILAPILKESLFLRCGEAARAGDRIFRVTIERDRRGLFEKEIERVLSGVLPEDSRILRAIFESVPCEIPVREAKIGAGHEASIQWRGTQRRGKFFQAEKISPAELAMAVDSGDLSFTIVIAPEGFSLPDGEIFPPSALVWTPHFEKEDREILRKFYGAMILSSEGDAERPVKDEAASFVKEGGPQIAKVIDAAFRNGRFIRSSGEECEAGDRRGATGFIEKCITDPVTSLLEELHPRFAEVAPSVDFVSRRALVPLIDAILAPGKISMAQARKNNTRLMIEGVLVAMGLSRVHGASYEMQLDPGKSRLVADVMDDVGEGADLAKLSLKLKTGPWGLSDEMIAILITALVRGGLVELKKDGRRIPSGIVNFSHVDEADEIQAGELLEPRLREKLFADVYLSRGMDPGSFSISTQREAWENLLTLRERVISEADGLDQRLAGISEYPVFDSFDFERARAAIESGIKVAAEINPAHGSSKGLAKYLSSDRPDMNALLGEIAAIREFAESGAEKMIRIADYLGGLPPEDVLPEDISHALSDLRSLISRLTEIVLGGGISDIAAAFDRFFELYSAWYVEEHRRAFAFDNFSAFEKIRETPEYLALKSLSAISGIHLVDGAQVANRRIDSVLSSRCTRAPSAETRFKALCSCGFVPGASVQTGDANIIMESVRAGISEGIAALSDGAMLEKIVARISALRDIDSAKARQLEDFFRRLRDGVSIDAFVKIFTPQVAHLLDEALKRKVSVVLRDINLLTERMSGRRLPPARLRAIFDEWMGDLGGGDVVVDVKSGGETAPSVEEALAGWITDHGFDDTAARLSLIVPPQIKPSSDERESVVDEGRLAQMVEIAGLFKCDGAISKRDGAICHGAICLDLLSREKRFPQFAWEVARGLTNHLIDGWRPPSGTEINCRFAEVELWVKQVLSVTAPFESAVLGEVIRAEAFRERSFSFIEEHHHMKGFPSSQIVERLKDIAACAASERDRVFESLGTWDVNFETAIKKWPDAVFLFVDAARWDLASRFGGIIGRATLRRSSEEKWHLNPKASTAGWQEAFFGTSDFDAIRSMMQNRSVQYWGDVERAEIRARMTEQSKDGPMWLRLGFIDKMLHSTSLPFYRVMDEAAREFEEMMAGLAKVIGGRTLVFLSDHGFSEAPGAAGGARYTHDASRISDTVAAMMVFEKKVNSNQ